MAVMMGTMEAGTETATPISAITLTSAGPSGMASLYLTIRDIPVTLPTRTNLTTAPKTTPTIRVVPQFLIVVGKGSARMCLR